MWGPPIWRTVPGARRYAVSDSGHVRGRHGVLATRLNGEGYPKVKLVCDDGVRRDLFVHAVVALAFIGPRPQGHFVLHTNGCRTDARASNLRYGTHADNHRDKIAHGTCRATRRKLTPRAVREIRRASGSVESIAARRGLSVSHVREIRNGRKWRSL